MSKYAIRKGLMLFTSVLLSLALTPTHAGTQPKFEFTPTTPTTVNIPFTDSTTVQYRVTNNTQVTRTLTMLPISGVSQITTNVGDCPNPFVLAHGEHCLLTLNVFGSSAGEPVTGGPKICKTKGAGDNSPDAFLCSQPSRANTLNVTWTAYPLKITAVTPSSGSVSGKTFVTITGSNLRGTNNITFGGAPATNITVIDSTTLTAYTSAHVAGEVDVIVSTDLATTTLMNAYTYVNLAISPNVGATSGGTLVTITGADLKTTMGVSFDEIPATQFTVLNNTTITAHTPAHVAGAVNVSVTTSLVTTILKNGFTYVSPSISPTSGPSSGGQPISVTGVGLENTNDIQLGGSSATNLKVVSPTLVTALTPAHAASIVDVTVSSPTTSITLSNAYEYLDISIFPNSGTIAGNTNVTIIGGGAIDLTNATVTFGGQPANIQMTSMTKVVLKTPEYPTPIAVDVVISTQASGTIILRLGYTYILEIGNSYEGGVVACLNGSPYSNLVAATLDNSTSNAWENAPYPYSVVAYSEWDGLTNTATIYEYLKKTQVYAARTCAEYSSGNFKDWYLPALRQLDCLAANQTKISLSHASTYWSSTEYYSPSQNDLAWSVLMTNNSNGFILKSNSDSVRCVRNITPII